MQTMADQIYSEQYQKIRRLTLAIEAENREIARKLAQEMVADFSDLSAKPEAVQTLFFVDALLHRMDPQAHEVGNLYLIPHDGGQQIKLFNFMAEKFPLVRFAQELVNTACLKEMQDKESVVILDVGIGTGQQIVKLLERAFQDDSILKNGLKTRLQKVTVIGIEPAAESLTVAQTALLALAQKYPVDLQFEAMQKATEELDAADWRQLATWIDQAQGTLLVNASFALHHIRPAHLRSDLFNRLKALSPALLALIEPYADFLTPNLTERFMNAWHHYGLVFRAIDQTDAPVEEKNQIKKLFFSREIQDVLSEDQHRIEQFETGEMWMARIEGAGFRPGIIETEDLTLPNFPFVTIGKMPNYISLNVAGYPILSIITAR